MATDNIDRQKLYKAQYGGQLKKLSTMSKGDENIDNKNPNRVIGGLKSSGHFYKTLTIDGEDCNLATARYVDYLERQNRDLKNRCDTFERRIRKLERRLSSMNTYVNNSIGQTNESIRRINDSLNDIGLNE